MNNPRPKPSHDDALKVMLFLQNNKEKFTGKTLKYIVTQIKQSGLYSHGSSPWVRKLCNIVGITTSQREVAIARHRNRDPNTYSPKVSRIIPLLESIFEEFEVAIGAEKGSIGSVHRAELKSLTESAKPKTK